MTISRNLFVASVTLLFVAVPASAQRPISSADSQAVLRAAAVSAAHDLFSPQSSRFLERTPHGAKINWEGRTAIDLHKATSATLTERSAIVSCSNGPASCRMDPSAELLSIERPRFD